MPECNYANTHSDLAHVGGLPEILVAVNIGTRIQYLLEQGLALTYSAAPIHCCFKSDLVQNSLASVNLFQNVNIQLAYDYPKSMMMGFISLFHGLYIEKGTMPNTYQQGAVFDELGSIPTQINKQAVTETQWDLGQENHMLRG